MRLDKFMSEMGVLSRKECAKIVKRGGITVNGVPQKRADVHIDPETDVIALLGEVIKYSEFVYIMMNKPAGILSATEDPKQETVIASGVSSMMRSTPVRVSTVRILRPSRPIILPFISSLGSATTDTVASAT